MRREQRKRTRVPIGFTVAVSVQGKRIKVNTVNISLTGILCATDSRFTAGEPCIVSLTLISHVQVSMEGIILRVGPSETAISFSSMNEESFFHLKKLVEYNHGDADKIDRELTNPGFSA